MPSQNVEKYFEDLRTNASILQHLGVNREFLSSVPSKINSSATNVLKVAS